MRARNAAGAAVAGTALLSLIVFALLISPIIVMLGTDYLHNGLPFVPELSFPQSVVTVLVARALFYTQGARGGN